MPVNKSVGTGASGRRTGSATTRASGIPSSTLIVKSSDDSPGSLTKVGTLQLNDGKITTETPPRQQSLTRDRATIPARTIGSGGETDSKQGRNSTTSTSLSTCSSVKGVTESLTKVARKTDRGSPSVSSLTGVNGAISSEVHCKPESSSKVNHSSSLPLAVSSSKVDRTSTKVPADHPKTGAVGASASKRSSPGSSVGTKGLTQPNFIKAKSPPLSCRIPPEASGKSDAHVRKTTGIAKLQNPPTCSRPLPSTNSRPRSSPGSSSIPSSRAPSSSRPKGPNELSANLTTRGKTDDLGRREIRSKTGYKVDNSSGSTFGGNKKALSVAKIPKLHVLNNISSNRNSIQDLGPVIHSSQDTISKNIEDSVDNTSEFEFFSETKSNMSETMSNLGDDDDDDDITLELNITELEAEKLSALRKSLETRTAQLDASTEDIFTSCEDIICAMTHDNEEISRNSNLVNDFNVSNTLADDGEISDDKSNCTSELCVIDKNSGRENETEICVEEDTFANHLEIVEDGQFVGAVESTECECSENRATSAENNNNIPNETSITDILLQNNGNNEVTSSDKQITGSDDIIEHHELGETKASSYARTADDNISIDSPADRGKIIRIDSPADRGKIIRIDSPADRGKIIRIDSPADRAKVIRINSSAGKIDFDMNDESSRECSEIEISLNDGFNSCNAESDAVSIISDAVKCQMDEDIGLDSVGKALQIKDAECLDSQVDSQIDSQVDSHASMNPDTGHCMKKTSDYGFSCDGQRVISDNSFGDCQVDDHSSTSSFVIVDGFGADGTADSDGETGPGCSVRIEANFQGTLPANSAAAASGGEYEVGKDRGQSSGTVGGSCETLRCECESDASSSVDVDGVPGLHGHAEVNKNSKLKHLAEELTDGYLTDFQCKPCNLAECQKLSGSENESDMQNNEVKDSVYINDVEIPNPTLLHHQETILKGKSSEDELEEKCEDVGEDTSQFSLPNLGSSDDNCSDIGSDVKPAMEIKDNDTTCHPTEQHLLVGGRGQLSACFIKEFSAWLPNIVTESGLKHVPGYKCNELNDDICDQNEVSDVPYEEDLFNFNMNRKRDLRLVFPISDESSKFTEKPDKETNDARKMETEQIHSREKFDAVLTTDSVVLGGEVPSTQMGLDEHEPSSSSTLTEFSLTDQTGSQYHAKVSDSMPPVTPSVNQANELCILENLTMYSSANSSFVSSGADEISNQSALQNGENNEAIEIQNSNKDSVEGVHVTSANDTSMKCTANVEEENCTRSRNGSLVAETGMSRAKDQNTKLTVNSSTPLLLGGIHFGSSTKELDHLVHRAPSPLNVLTDPCHSVENDEDAHSHNFPDRKSSLPSEIPLLSMCRFRPISTKDYFTVSSNDSLDVPQLDADIATELLQSNSDKVIEDANHNVVGKTVSVNTDSEHMIASEIHDFMSPKYLPSRPLSQICTRTLGRSLRRSDGGDDSSLTSVESLPVVDSRRSEIKASVLDQIHFARSCSRIGRVQSPSTTRSGSVAGQSCSTPRLPVAGSLPSFELYRGSSGKTLKPGTPSSFSQAGSSRHSLCSTPVISEGSSPCPTPTRVSMFEISSRDTSRNVTPILRHYEDVHGSAVSLASLSSSVYSNCMDEKQAMEIKKLKHELETARETIVSLTTQLNVYVLMSKSYEQNIEGLNQRLKQLTTIIDQKESELCELRSLKIASLSSGDVCGSGGLQTIPDCVSVSSAFHRRASNYSSLPYDARSAGLKYLPVLSRHISCESVSSLNSQSSSCSMGSQQSATLYSETKKKKKNWIRSSFSRAFSRKKNKPGSVGEADSSSLQSDTSTNESIAVENQTTPATKGSPSEELEVSSDGLVTELEEKLREADRHLTDLRLDSLASIQHMEQLQETISCLEQQVATLKVENKSLHRRLLEKGTSPTGKTSNQPLKRSSDLVHQSSFRSTPPGNALPSSCSADGLLRLNVSTSHEMSSPKLLQRFSLVDAMASDASCDQLRRVSVFVIGDSFGEVTKTEEESITEKSRQIGILMLSEQTTWQDLDMRLGSLFVEHIHVLDPDAGLGMDEKSISSYRLGNQERIPNSKMADIFPSKVLTAANASIKIRLRDWQDDCVDFLAFDTLVPKPLLIQYVSLLTENQRLLFCGPNLSGKTFLARKLARHLVLRKEKKLSSVSIAHFTVDSKSSKELQQYLSNIVSHCEQGSNRLPSVIVIDNLHLADNLSKAFSGFFTLGSQSCPYLIGTMTQSRAASITCLQFHQNFRWVLFGLTEEPVKSFLARYLHRQWTEKQFRQSGSEDGDCGLLRVVDWMPKVWQHVNRFVASVCCPDKCIGPGIFLSCPMDVDKARTWFVDLWNYSVGPYLLQLLKDSPIHSGSNQTARSEDPTDWVLETSPWENSKCRGSEAHTFPLLRLFPYSDSSNSREQNQVLSPTGKQILPNSSSCSDTLLDMLLHLQVTACFTDSNTTPINNVTKNRFIGLSATSSKISANLNSLHSAAS